MWAAYVISCLEVLGFAWRDEAQLMPIAEVVERPEPVAVAGCGAGSGGCGMRRGSYGLAGAWARAGVVERPERSAGRASFL
jgi:hypothetical protein